MATQSLPHPVPAPQPTTITQFDLARFVSLGNQLDAMQRDLEQLSARLSSQLTEGARIEPGTHTARLESYQRRSVAWKDVVVSLKGEDYANAVLAVTEPKTYSKLIVR